MKTNRELLIDAMIDEIERDAFDEWHWNKEAGQYMGFFDKELCREIILRWLKKDRKNERLDRK